MKSIALAALLVSGSAVAAGPFRIVIFADQNATTRANEIQNYLKTQVPPFNRMQDADISITVRTLTGTENQMNCQRNASINRLVTCNDTYLQNLAGNAMVVAVTSVPLAGTNPDEAGGSGGSIAVATTNLPLQTVVHEMLHVAGVSDEYQYTGTAEISAYCTPDKKSMNFAFFAERPPYASDGAARSTHGGGTDVLWMERILPTTQVITSATDLGTPPAAAVNGQQRIGLYESDTCPPDSQGRKSWRPYQNSIMRSQNGDPTVYPVYEQAFVDYASNRIGDPLRLRERSAPERTRVAALEVDIPLNNSTVITEESGASTVSPE